MYLACCVTCIHLNTRGLMQTTLFIHKPLIIFKEDRDSFVREVTSHSKVIFRFALSRRAIINTCTYTNLKHKCLRKDLLSCNPKW